MFNFLKNWIVSKSQSRPRRNWDVALRPQYPSPNLDHYEIETPLWVRPQYRSPNLHDDEIETSLWDLREKRVTRQIVGPLNPFPGILSIQNWTRVCFVLGFRICGFLAGNTWEARESAREKRERDSSRRRRNPRYSSQIWDLNLNRSKSLSSSWICPIKFRSEVTPIEPLFSSSHLAFFLSGMSEFFGTFVLSEKTVVALDSFQDFWVLELGILVDSSLLFWFFFFGSPVCGGREELQELWFLGGLRFWVFGFCKVFEFSWGILWVGATWGRKEEGDSERESELRWHMLWGQCM